MFETVDVLEGQLGGGVAVAVDDRRQDRGVLVDVFGHVGQAFQEQAEDPGDEVVVPDQHVFQMRVAGRTVDGAVHGHVQPHQVGRVGGQIVDGAEAGEQVLDRGALTRGGPLGCAAGGQGLQLYAYLVDVGQIGDLDTGRERSAARVRDDEAVVFEALERFADGGAPHLQFTGHPTVVDRFAGPDLQRGQPVPQGQVGAIGKDAGGLSKPVLMIDTDRL